MTDEINMLDIPASWDKQAWDALEPETKKRLTDSERNDIARAHYLADLEEILTMQSGAGERVFREMFMSSGIFSEVFTGNSETYFRQGLKAFALHYWNMLCESENAHLLTSKLRPPYTEHPYFVPEDAEESRISVKNELNLRGNQRAQNKHQTK